MTEDIRKPVVASVFYPEDKLNLKRMIKTFLSNVPSDITEFLIKSNIDNIFGLIVPHAGYVYSGQVASFGYSLINEKSFDTVVLIGPSHRTYFEGFSLCRFKAYGTPFGEIPIDTKFSEALIKNGGGIFDYLDSAHTFEHSIEVQLPFLYSTLINNFEIVPIVMGEQSYENAVAGASVIAETLKETDKSALFIISTDLSHYHSDEMARELDDRFMKILSSMNAKKLIETVNQGDVEACGAGPVAVFIEIAKKMGKNNIKNLVYKNSGETSGDYSRVVGYLSSVIW
jgi:hypothetical protein